MEAPRIRRFLFILKYRVPLLWPTYIGERRTTFAKAYGMDKKVRCYGEHVGKHIGNLGNILGTCILGNMGGSPQIAVSMSG
jgi:hypothetical protein